MEALGALEDAEVIAREVRELQQQWRQAADVPRDKADGLWRRFKAAHDAVWARCESHFAAEAQARAENLAKKVALCEQAEALADSTDWIQTADAIKKLQSDWKDDRSGLARSRESDLGSLPHRLRPLLHPAPRRPRPAQDASGPRTWPRKTRSARGSRRWPSRPTGSRPRSKSSGCRPSGSRSVRSRRADRKRSGSASAPPAIAFSSAMPSGTTSRAPIAWRRVKRSAPSSRACLAWRGGTDEPPADLLADRLRRTFAAAGSRRSPRAASIPIARERSTRGSPTAFAAVLARGRRLQRHRSRSRRQPQTDGSAGQEGRRSRRRRLPGRRGCAGRRVSPATDLRRC